MIEKHVLFNSRQTLLKKVFGDFFLTKSSKCMVMIQVLKMNTSYHLLSHFARKSILRNLVLLQGKGSHLLGFFQLTNWWKCYPFWSYPQVLLVERKKERNLFTPTKLYSELTGYWVEWMWLYQEDAKQESYGQGT